MFGFWAFVLIAVMAMLSAGPQAVAYAESRQFTEPVFVFVIMAVAASRPVLAAIRSPVAAMAALAPLRSSVAQVWICLALVPLVAPFITEPAAMKSAALMLAPWVLRPGMPAWTKYGALDVLFVKGIGGQPPHQLGRTARVDGGGHLGLGDSALMAATFGCKAAIPVLINATVIPAIM